MTNKLTCKKCGHVWESRVADPASCPKCKSYKWQEKRVYGEKDKEGKKQTP